MVEGDDSEHFLPQWRTVQVETIYKETLDSCLVLGDIGIHLYDIMLWSIVCNSLNILFYLSWLAEEAVNDERILLALWVL